HKSRQFLLEWPSMTAPWSAVVALAALLPILGRGRPYRPRVWFPWWWAIGNLAMFSLWTVAKPNYYLPCLPGAALLGAFEWVRLTRTGRLPGRDGAGARRVLQAHWVVLFAAAVVCPIVVRRQAPEFFVPATVAASALAVAVPASVWAWRKG